MIPDVPLTLFLIVIATLFIALTVVLARSSERGIAHPVILCAAWLSVTGALPFILDVTNLGVAAQFPTFAATLAVTVVLAISPFGKHVVAINGLALLAAIQVFRLPLEIVLIQWYDAGFMPVQMTWRGDNLDIVTGLAALPSAALISFNYKPHLVAYVFNILGLAMLVRIIGIVALSSPTPLRNALGGYAAGPDVLVGLYFPTVWIASIGVAGAVFLHVACLAFLIKHRKANMSFSN